MTNKRGTVLVLCYLFVAILVTIGSAMMVRSASEQNVTQYSSNLSRAFHLAESALDAAMIQLRTGGAGAISQAIVPTSPSQGTYSATITQPSDLPPGQYLVRGDGQINGVTQSVEGVVQSQMISPFQWALFGTDQVKARGNVQTDSFNSSQGSYEATHGSNGDLGTDATANKSIEVRGHSLINGDAFIGEGGDPATGIRVSGSSVITGEQAPAIQTYVFPTPEPPSGVENLGNLKLHAGDELTLAAGTYWYDSFKAAGGSVIRVSGPVTIYVSRKVKIGGKAFVGEDDDEAENDIDEDEGFLSNPITAVSDDVIPTQLTIKVIGTDTVNIKGRSIVHAAIYAPNAKVKIGGRSELFGSVVAKKVDVKGRSQVHYDEALANGGSQELTNRTSLLSWRSL